MPKVLGNLKSGGFDKDKIKLVIEVAATGENADKIPTLIDLMDDVVEVVITRIHQSEFDAAPRLIDLEKKTLKAPPLSPGTGIWFISESDSEFPEDSPTMLEDRFTTRENAVKEMERLSGLNREKRYVVDELTASQLEEENKARPFGVFKVDPDDFRELMPERFETQEGAQVYADSLLTGEETRIAECVEAEIAFTRHTFEVANLLDQDEETADDTEVSLTEEGETAAREEDAFEEDGEGVPAEELEESATAAEEVIDLVTEQAMGANPPDEKTCDNCGFVPASGSCKMPKSGDCKKWQPVKAEVQAAEVAADPPVESPEAEPIADESKQGACPLCGSTDIKENFAGTGDNRCNSCKKLFTPEVKV